MTGEVPPNDSEEEGRTRLSSILPALGHRTLVMGIVNTTPDSFSDGGTYLDPDAAAERALMLLAAGADLVDIGGESTRPGADPVPAELELARVIPVIETLSAAGIDAISIDTTKAEVARYAVLAGARMINDVSGLTFDPQMLDAVVEAAVPVVITHTRGRPREMMVGELVYEGGVVASVKRALVATAARAMAAGVPAEDIVLDPGIGFGKTLEQNLELLRCLDALVALGHPVLVGTSRKSFLGALTRKDVNARGYATAASVALAIAHGAAIVRVHDVAEMVDVVRVTDAIVRGTTA